MIPRLDRIIIHPIKSLDGISVQSTQVMPGGSLQHDREYAIFDEDHRVVNAKRTPKIQLLRSDFNLDAGTVTISAPDTSPEIFDLGSYRLEDWLTGYFGFVVHLEQNAETGFPDDLKSPGPTIISKATLTRVSQWFTGSTSTKPAIDFAAIWSLVTHPHSGKISYREQIFKLAMSSLKA
jgi:uncharacterized protein